MRIIPLLALIGLTACTTNPTAEVTKRGPSAELTGIALPAMESFAGGRAAPTQRSNAQIAADVLDLEFHMESGRALPALTRFEGPITIGFDGPAPATAQADLARLIGRFRAEAGLEVSMAAPGTRPSIAIEFRSRAEMARAVPTAACFVVPNATSFDDYRSHRGSPAFDWANLTVREHARVFIPLDTPPQEIRDCLHEELAQAMGPLNDLYRLPDSVFNDDNFHTILTGFDMLALRVHYAPELANGMTEGQVAARLPAVLARLNPAGQGLGGPVQTGLNLHPWEAAVAASFAPRGGPSGRAAAADRMVQIAMAQGWRDNRLAFAFFAQGRSLTATDPEAAVRAFTQARRLYGAIPGAEIQAAHCDMQLAAIALASGQDEMAVTLADRALPAVRQAQNAALLATLMLIKAGALDHQGRAAEARALRLDSMGWARYGFGAEGQMRARIAEISALSARGAAARG
ncbi:MAG: DUF2927 domain-containing protein [Paracoccaceae bacterium]